MSLYYRTLLNTLSLSTLQIDFLTKTDTYNLINLTTDTVTISSIISSLVHNIQINTSSTNYTIEVYNSGTLYQTFSNLSGNTNNSITASTGVFTYFITGSIGTTFTTQLNISYIGGPPPQSVTATGYNSIGQTI